VRALEALPHGDPPTSAEREHCRLHVGDFLRSQVQPELAAPLRRERAAAGRPGLMLVATGGTASILAAMDLQLASYARERIEGLCLASDPVRCWVERLWSLPLAQRRALPGLPPARADVMLTGAVIFEQVMNVFEFPELRVSTRGLRFAALKALWNAAGASWPHPRNSGRVAARHE
jgi:exopolyphosphatase/guanosine-5'-triphosphate,3'-diphosphate pyrophosphatase